MNSSELPLKLIMNKFTTHFISILLAIALGLSASNTRAQSWQVQGNDMPNYCVGVQGTTPGTCMCPSGYTYGVTQQTGENCQTAGDIAANDGCWNPGTGKCYTCGSGGTMELTTYNIVEFEYAYIYACFGGSDGQANAGSNGNLGMVGTIGSAAGAISCTTNSQCIPWNGGATSGGFDQNSDQRLKRDIAPIAVTESGIQLYSFKYLWSDQVYVGVMAQDLLEHPQWKEAVITKQNGFYAVNYRKLGLEMTTLEQYQQHHAVASVK